PPHSRGRGPGYGPGFAKLLRPFRPLLAHALAPAAGDAQNGQKSSPRGAEQGLAARLRQEDEPHGKPQHRRGPPRARTAPPPPTRPPPPPRHALSNVRASATPGAGWPAALAVTRASAVRCIQRNFARPRANSSLTVWKYFSACNAPSSLMAY